MFMHWKISGVPAGAEERVTDALNSGTTVSLAVPQAFDSEGRLGMTVYFPDHYSRTDSPEQRARMAAAFQTLLRDKLSCPMLTIEDVTRR